MGHFRVTCRGRGYGGVKEIGKAQRSGRRWSLYVTGLRGRFIKCRTTHDQRNTGMDELLDYHRPGKNMRLSIHR